MRAPGSSSTRALENVSRDLRSRYFEKVPKSETCVARPALRDLLLVKRLNLSRPPFPLQGPMDVIFCRNVMIYFDGQTRQRLVNEFVRLLKPGGHLIISKSESLVDPPAALERGAGPSVYRKRDDA